MKQESIANRNRQLIKASFHQKSAGISLFILILLALYFIVETWSLYAPGPVSSTVSEEYFGLVLKHLGLVIILEIVLQIVLTIGQGSAPKPTQAEQIAAWRANTISYGVLLAGIIGVIGLYSFAYAAIFLANTAMLALFLAEIIRFSLQLIFSRGIT